MIDNKRLASIGVFDSGVGGLTVVKEIMNQLPKENIVYFGDMARVPYGSKSSGTIIKYSRQIIRFLQSQNVKAIVVACNTASALALETMEKEFDLPIIGVVEPGAKTAVSYTNTKSIGIIGTEGTIKSRIYSNIIHQYDPSILTFGEACPLFVPLVEEGWLHDKVTDEVARRYLVGLKEKNIDSLILGCTHYPLLINTIQKAMGKNVKLINPAYETALSLRELLNSKSLTTTNEIKTMKHRFYASDASERFKRIGNSIGLPFYIDEVEHVNIETY